MSSLDLTRSATDFRKHYKSLRAQQGRILTDDDFNDNERFHDEDERRSRVHIIGPAGSPDAGFQVTNPAIVSGRVDFEIQPGTFYLGGHAAELEAVEHYRTQRDFLTLQAFENLGNLDGIPLALAPAPNTTRRDAVVLEAFLQPVTGVEDDETIEKALAAGDTAGRMRLHRRVLCMPGLGGADCATAWSSVQAALTAANLGSINAENELITNATLTVGFANNGGTPDLCTPPVALGYLGAENQAIRVQMLDAGHYTWSYDNGSPLYRVQIGAQVGGPPTETEIRMLTLPKDQVHWPVAGQIVELMRWEAWLPNGEKIAERSGQLFRVSASYDSDTQVLRVTGLIPANFGMADVWPTAAQLGAAYVYMRVWNRGGDTASPLSIPIATGDLMGTGLRVTFAGQQRRDDFYIIAARPDTPDLIVPWQLKAGRAPHGVRRYYALLGIIEWTSVPSAGPPLFTGTVISDCRPGFLPLTRIRGCCTYTVGDGTSTFGQFQNIQKAINMLPAGGGEICLLPGVFIQNFEISGKSNIRVHGCGSRTIVRDASKGAKPVIMVSKSSGILLDSFRVESPVTHCIESMSVTGFLVQGMELAARDSAAIQVRDGERVRIIRNRITASALEKPLASGSPAGQEPAVFLQSDELLVELNRIEVNVERAIVRPLGGIQIGGGSGLVEIRRNWIRGGNGNGITLGSIVFEPAGGPIPGIPVPGGGIGGILGGITITIDENGCIHFNPNPVPPAGPNDTPLEPRSEGSITGIWIIENVISIMGQNGISSMVFPFRTRFLTPLLRYVTIDSNSIAESVTLDLPPTQGPPAPADPRARAGVSLADVEVSSIRENLIENNGRTHVDGVCGVFIYHGESLEIESNRISDNGPVVNLDTPPHPGRRGGIYIRRGTPRLTSLLNPAGSLTAAILRGNLVLSPVGPALHLNVSGDAVVEGNSFTSGTATFARDEESGAAQAVALLGGHAVRIYALEPLSTSTTKLTVNTTAEMILTTVQFNNNVTDLLKPGFVSSIFSATLLFGFADFSVANCSFSARFPENALVLIDVLIWGVSVRVTASRFAESMQGGVSLISVGGFNQTSLNQAARCIMAFGQPKLLVFRGNRSLAELLPGAPCVEASKVVQASLGLGALQGAADPQEV